MKPETTAPSQIAITIEVLELFVKEQNDKYITAFNQTPGYVRFDPDYSIPNFLVWFRNRAVITEVPS